MHTYGQFCPTAKAAELFCERWTALILRDLLAGSTRFSELQRGLPLASPTLLSRRLKQLEAEGVVENGAESRVRAQLDLHLTQAGQEFAPLVHGLAVWGQRWSSTRAGGSRSRSRPPPSGPRRGASGPMPSGPRVRSCASPFPTSPSGRDLVVRERERARGSLSRGSGLRGRSLPDCEPAGHDLLSGAATFRWRGRWRVGVWRRSAPQRPSGRFPAGWASQRWPTCGRCGRMRGPRGDRGGDGAPDDRKAFARRCSSS